MNGFLVIDKPLGISSRDAVDRVMKALPKDVRVGHTGTLDPLASGVLVLALGQATRLADYVQAQTKEYIAGVRFGIISATDDAEGPLTTVAEAPLPTREQFDAALATFVGVLEQTPPAFSAAHVDGRRAYRIARAGKPVELKPKPVRIDRIEVLDFQPPDTTLRIQCGKGTYIRSIARDLGRRFGCGAYLTSLRRLRVGVFSSDAALPIDASAEQVAARLRPLRDAVVELPQETLDDDAVRRLSMGQAISTNRPLTDEIAILGLDGELKLIGRVADGVIQPEKVFVDPRKR